jgi:hypothetical protein
MDFNQIAPLRQEVHFSTPDFLLDMLSDTD